MPDTIQFSSGNQIINRYAADGRKLGTEYFTKLIQVTIPINKDTTWTYSSGLVNQSGTVYIDNKEYSTLNGNPALTALQRIYNAEGYADTITATIPNYKYFRRDHLGNNREVWVANTKKTLQRTQYYPSGLPWASNAGDNPGLQERKYNGKEFVEMNGYDGYDYGARTYFPDRNGWPTLDPLAEKNYSISPYAYCGGNPVNRIDPDGRFDMSDLQAVCDMANAAIDKLKNKAKQAIKEVKQEAKKITKKVTDTTKNAQTFVKNNKSEILNVAQSLQTTGKNTTYAGLVCAAVGAPVAGVGAAPGVAISSAGGALTTVGIIIEKTTNFVTGDSNDYIKTGISIATDIAVKNTVNNSFPVPTVGIQSVLSESIKTVATDATSTIISKFNTDTIDNYIFQINK